MVLKLDAMALELCFVTHKVTTTGKILSEIYVALSKA
jgi:hypothetical protein